MKKPNLPRKKIDWLPKAKPETAEHKKAKDGWVTDKDGFTSPTREWLDEFKDLTDRVSKGMDETLKDASEDKDFVDKLKSLSYISGTGEKWK